MLGRFQGEPPFRDRGVCEELPFHHAEDDKVLERGRGQEQFAGCQQRQEEGAGDFDPARNTADER